MRSTPLAFGLMLSVCAGAAADIFPTLGHTSNNAIPFDVGTASVPDHACTLHQVFDAGLFSTVTGGLPARITALAFAPSNNGTFNSNVTIRFAYTDAIPGVTFAQGGLTTPVPGEPGVPNADSAVTTFFSDPAYTATFFSASAANFQMVFTGTPFDYDPTLGNLLVEVVAVTTLGNSIAAPVSRTSGGPQASRAFSSTRYGPGVEPAAALRMDFTFTAVDPGGGCYANCDQSTTEPVLNVADFSCFLQAFAAGSSTANCDQSTAEPVLNVADFSCFLQAFAAGCP